MLLLFLLLDPGADSVIQNHSYSVHRISFTINLLLGQVSFIILDLINTSVTQLSLLAFVVLFDAHLVRR